LKTNDLAVCFFDFLRGLCNKLDVAIGVRAYFLRHLSEINLQQIKNKL